MSIEKELSDVVRRYLSEITEAASPYFYRMVQEGAIEKAEEMILSYALRNNVPVDTAIAMLESEME